MAYELGGKKRPWWDLLLASFGVGDGSASAVPGARSAGVVGTVAGVAAGVAPPVGAGARGEAVLNPFVQPDLPISPIVPRTFPLFGEPIKKIVPMRRRDTLLSGAKPKEYGRSILGAPWRQS